MKFILALLALVLVAPLAGCQCDSGSPTITVRNPFQIDREVPTVAGERLRQRTVTVMEAPSWQAAPQPAAFAAPCPPQNVVPFTAGAAAPCR